MFAVAISGQKEVDWALDVLSKSMPRPFLKGVMLGAAKPLVKSMKRNVRKDTGELKKGVKARVKKRLRKIVVVKVGPSKDQFWGMFQEFGTAHHGAHPWMRPAWEENADQMLQYIVAALATQLNREAKKINRRIARGKKFTKLQTRLLGV